MLLKKQKNMFYSFKRQENFCKASALARRNTKFWSVIVLCKNTDIPEIKTKSGFILCTHKYSKIYWEVVYQIEVISLTLNPFHFLHSND